MSNLLLTEEEKLLQSTIRTFAQKELAVRAPKYDEAEEFPWENINGLASLGIFGLGIDSKYGGTNGTVRQVAIAIEEIAKGCAATSSIVGAHLSLATQTINTLGNEYQKNRYLPELVTGKKIGAFGLTEAGGGSDVAGMKTSVVKRDNKYIINGAKGFITNGDIAEVIIIFATHDTSLRAKGISAFIVDKKTPGLTVSKQTGKMGIRASSTSEIILQNCKIPQENLIGREREGFKNAMQILDVSRIMIGAQGVGIAQAAFEAAVKYAQQREAFGQHLSSFQAIRWMIAEIATEIQAARLLTHYSAELNDNGHPFATEASMAKLFGSEIAVKAVDRALQIHGGYGYFKPSLVERLYRDAKITQIYEGTTEIQKLVISRNILRDMPI